MTSMLMLVVPLPGFEPTERLFGSARTAARTRLFLRQAAPADGVAQNGCEPGGH
jgi:hypothetical protein